MVVHPCIPDTQEVEIRRIMVQEQSEQTVSELHLNKQARCSGIHMYFQLQGK
jgi:hypothetical protein